MMAHRHIDERNHVDEEIARLAREEQAREAQRQADADRARRNQEIIDAQERARREQESQR